MRNTTNVSWNKTFTISYDYNYVLQLNLVKLNKIVVANYPWLSVLHVLSNSMVINVYHVYNTK